MKHTQSSPAAFGLGVLLAMMALAPLEAVRAGEIYKTVDAQGHVIYSDHPLTAASQRMSLNVREGDPEEAARLAKEQSDLAASQAQSAKDTAKQQTRALATEAAKQKQEARCQTARTRYATFKNGGRIATSDADGNLAYFSDEQIAEHLKAAKQDMDAACPS